MATPLTKDEEDWQALAHPLARLGVPEGGRVKKLRAVEDQSAPPEERMSEFGRINSIGGGRLMCAGGDGTGSVSTLTIQSYPLRVEQLEQTA